MRRALSRLAGRLGRCEGGATAVEFALILPVLLLAVFGTIEASMVLFIDSTIENAVFQASRFGTTGGAGGGVSRQDYVLQIIEGRTYGMVDMNKVHIDTLVYTSFANIGQPEPYSDTNVNHHYDQGEPFTDVNGNGKWDPDMGKAGLGGPSDVVVYKVSYAWGIITPFIRQVMGDSVAYTSSVAVRNEPF